MLQDAAVEAAQFERKLTREAADKNLADLKRAGMEINDFLPRRAGQVAR